MLYTLHKEKGRYILRDENDVGYTLQQAIRHEMRKKAWSIEDMADRSNIPYSTAYRYFAGHDTSTDNILKMVGALKAKLKIP